MTRLAWGKTGERIFEAGADRGVLYLPGQAGVPWNGLTAVSESPDGGEPRPYYVDGFKYINVAGSEEFKATISALSSPAEFGVCDGTVSIANGLFATQQPRRQFDFAYRTFVGNDIQSTDFGYKIHLVYNALAAPSSRENATVSGSTSPTGLSWAITTKPVRIPGMKPTAHLVIDSTKSNKVILSYLESILYGTDGVDARMPTAAELVTLFGWVVADMPTVVTIKGVASDATETIFNLAKDPSFETGNSLTSGPCRINLATNPSLEGGASTNWTFWAGTAPGAATAAVTQTGGAAFGLNFYRVTFSTQPGAPGGGGVIYDSGTTLLPNTTYTLSMYVRASVASTVYMISQLYNGATATTSASTSNTPVALAAGVWTRVWQTVTTGAADNHIQFRVYNSANSFVAGATFDGDAMLIEATSILQPYFDGSFTTTNMAVNTRGVATTSMFANSGSLHTVDKNVAITGHPQGITTAAKSRLTAGHAATASIASVYNTDGLVATNKARWLGIWLYSSLPNMKAYWFTDGQAAAVPIPQNQWFFLVSSTANAGNTYASIGVLTQDLSNITDESAYVLLTGVVAQDAPNISAFYDAALDDFNYRYSGTASASTSIQAAPTTLLGTMGNGIAIKSKLWAYRRASSVRLIPSLTSAATTMIVASLATGQQAQLAEGKTYTIKATRRIFVALSGVLATTTYLGRISLITTNLGAFYSDVQLPNTPGTAQITWTVTIPVGSGAATVRLGHGGPVGSGDVWWDDLLITEVPDVNTPYTGPYFDGESLDFTYKYQKVNPAWTAAVDGSQSSFDDILAISTPGAVGDGYLIDDNLWVFTSNNYWENFGAVPI